MNNMVKNTEVKVMAGKSINEKDILNLMLTLVKEMSKNYAIALTELSNETLFKKQKKIFDNILSLQREIYELCFKNGWYVIEKSLKTACDNKFSTLNKEYNDLNLEK